MNIAEEAAKVVEDRMAVYGPPGENHACTAELWRAYVKRRFGLNVPFDAEAVCWLNVLQKISRQANESQRDNLVDVVGFVLNAELVQDAA